MINPTWPGSWLRQSGWRIAQLSLLIWHPPPIACCMGMNGSFFVESSTQSSACWTVHGMILHCDYLLKIKEVTVVVQVVALAPPFRLWVVNQLSNVLSLGSMVVGSGSIHTD